MPNKDRIAWLGTPTLGRLGLAIDGYQFPGHQPAERGDHDANWLVIHGRVEFPGLGSWSFRDACLLTWELELRIAWLREFPSVPSGSIEFVEPLLRFFVDRNTPESARLAVTLRCEALRGANFDDETRWHSGRTLLLNTTPESIQQFCDQMGEQLHQHPQR